MEDKDHPLAEPRSRFDWERLVFRAELPKHLKTLCWALAIFANKDGSNVRPGREVMGDGLDDSERTIEQGIGELRTRGLLILVKRGGGTNRGGRANVYQLSAPGAELEMRLDPDYVRLYPKKPGRRPARVTDPKSTSAQKPVENPVDNPDPAESHPKPTSGQSGDSPEVGCNLTRSGPQFEPKPTSPYQIDQPLTNTSRVVPMGGDLTSADSINGKPHDRSPPSAPRRNQPKRSNRKGRR